MLDKYSNQNKQVYQVPEIWKKQLLLTLKNGTGEITSQIRERRETHKSVPAGYVYVPS